MSKTDVLHLRDSYGDALELSVDDATPTVLDIDLYSGSQEHVNHELTRESAAQLRDALTQWIDS